MAAAFSHITTAVPAALPPSARVASHSLSSVSICSRSSGGHAMAAVVSSRRFAARQVGAGIVSVTCKVSVGDAAPSFTLKDQNGRSVSLSKFKGKNVVLYFYPADDTPGCTKQACSFRDSYAEFKKLGAEVVGISGDSPESHKAFAEKYELPYTLLSDEGNEVRKEWGVPSDLFGVLPGRQTYVIDKKGVVQLIFNNQFQPEKHIDETIALLESQKEEPKPTFQFPKLF